LVARICLPLRIRPFGGGVPVTVSIECGSTKGRLSFEALLHLLLGNAISA
jgi:hypothetical protein